MSDDQPDDEQPTGDDQIARDFVKRLFSDKDEPSWFSSPTATTPGDAS